MTNLTASSGTTYIGGDYNVGNLVPNGGLIVFDTTPGATIDGSGGAFNNVQVSTDKSLIAALAVGATLTIDAGATLSTQNYSINAAAILCNGTLDASAQTTASITVSGNLSGSGTVTGGGGLIDVNGNASMATLITNAGDVDIDGAVSITTLTVSAANTIYIGGDFTTPTANFTPDGGTIYLDVVNSSNITVTSYNNLTIADTITTAANWTVAGQLLVTAGSVLDVVGNNLAAATFDNQGTLRRTGPAAQVVAQDNNAGAPNSGLVIYYGSVAGADIEDYGAGNDYWDLQVDSAAGNTFTLSANLSVANDFTISQGIVDAVGFNLAVTGTYDNQDTLRRTGAGGQNIELDNDSGLVIYYGAAGGTIQEYGVGIPDYWDLEIEGTGSLAPSADLELDNDLTISGGTLDAAGFTINLAGSWNNTGGIFSHGNGRVVFDGAGNETLQSNSQSFWDLEIDKINVGDTITLQDNLYVDHDLIITRGVLDANSIGLIIYMNAIGASSTWNNDASKTASGDFTPGNSRVVVGGSLDFLGSTTFWEFRFIIVAGNPTLRFEAGETQTFNGTPLDAVRIQGADAANRITLTSTAAAQWNIIMNSTSIIYWCLVSWSNACSGPVITPADTIDGGNNNCWSFSIPIVDARTLDFDSNGRIDRIRLEAQQPVNDQFAGVTVAVAGYTVTSIQTHDGGGGGDLDEFIYIWLQEKPYLDTSVTPNWAILINTDPDGGGPLEKLRAKAGGAEVQTNPGYDPSIDRAGPVIGYTATAAGNPRTYLYFSELVYGAGGVPIASGDFTFLAANPTAVTPINPTGNGTREAFLDWPAPVNGAQITAFTNITATVEDASGNAISVATHNISDVGLNLVEPVWAVNVEADLVTPIPVRDPLRGGIGRITQFDGRESAWLQARNILLQARILEGTIAGITLHFDDAPVYPTRVLGLWVPDGPPASGTDDLVHYHSENYNTTSVDDDETVVGVDLRGFELLATDPPIKEGVDLEFLFVTASGLPCARIPNPNDPRTATPWLIRLRKLRTQRGEVTVSNNVINPLRGETVKVTYTITQTGMVTINVLDLKGDIVDVLYRGQKDPGEYATAWDGRNRGNRVVARGVYFIKIVGPGINEIRKVLVVK